MNERPAADRLRQAMRNITVDEFETAADELGRQAVAVALAEPPAPAPPERYKLSEEEERQNLLDDALSDAEKAMERHRDRLGRRVTSRHDARVMRQIFELLRGMADATGGVDNDPSFQ